MYMYIVHVHGHVFKVQENMSTYGVQMHIYMYTYKCTVVPVLKLLHSA